MPIIIKATYGGIDCTSIVQSKVNGEKLILRADNNIIGDPIVGTVKYLQVTIKHNEVIFNENVKEGELLIFPKPVLNRLGVFYSNNNNKLIYDAIDKSLDTIKIASSGKADIITCTWERIPNNPFLQLDSWYKSQSHLNQLLQIMQCLYAAKEINNYKYVSFLEHDVLYPEGYFNYPDFEAGNILVNMNYGGINKDGWQRRGQNDGPFHQMTMHFNDAIEHCEYILPNALRTNSGMIESQNKRIQWQSINEAIHINHGVHFTSHNSIYQKNDTYKKHPYWGEHFNYLYLFH